MKNIQRVLACIALIAIIQPVAGQNKKDVGAATITSSDLKSHLSFLASPLLGGRTNGDDGLDIAASYIASLASKIGLKPANNGSYYQYYPVVKKSIDTEKTFIEIFSNGKPSQVIREKIYQLVPMGASDFEIEGDVVFAGYGIRADKYGYNDFDTLKLAGKILLVMDRAPQNADGT